jgi:hypothetical protein
LYLLLKKLIATPKSPNPLSHVMLIATPKSPNPFIHIIRCTIQKAFYHAKKSSYDKDYFLSITHSLRNTDFTQAGKKTAAQA